MSKMVYCPYYEGEREKYVACEVAESETISTLKDILSSLYDHCAKYEDCGGNGGCVFYRSSTIKGLAGTCTLGGPYKWKIEKIEEEGGAE